MPNTLIKKTEFKNSPEVERAVKLHQEGWELSRRGKKIPPENNEYVMAIFVQKTDGTWGTVRGQTETHFSVSDIIPHEQMQHMAYKNKIKREEEAQKKGSFFKKKTEWPKVFYFGDLGDVDRSLPESFGPSAAASSADHPATDDLAYKPGV